MYCILTVSTLKSTVKNTFNLTIYLLNKRCFYLLLVTIFLTVSQWLMVHLTGDAVK
jgi:hypothetical protein